MVEIDIQDLANKITMLKEERSPILAEIEKIDEQTSILLKDKSTLEERMESIKTEISSFTHKITSALEE